MFNISDIAEFEPFVYYDDTMGMVRVQLKDCRSVVEQITSGLEIAWEVDENGKQTRNIAAVGIYAPKIKLEIEPGLTTQWERS